MSTLLTTELLAVWTDPDTAMEAVGTNLGIFDASVASPTKVLASDERLRNTLFDVLLSLVEGGALEMRPCGGGRHAFRWRDDINGAISTVASVAPAVADPAPVVTPTVVEPEPAPPPPPPPVLKPPASADVSPVADISTPSEEHDLPSRPISQAPLLVVPAVSCLLAIVLYLWFDHTVALVFIGALALGGVVGLVRRVPFAGAWLLGLVAAVVLLRLS